MRQKSSTFHSLYGSILLSCTPTLAVLNLFTMEREGQSSLLKSKNSCPEAFDLFFNLTFPPREFGHLSPQRVLKRLVVDQSDQVHKANLSFAFLPGEPGSEGYSACYKAPKHDEKGTIS